MKKPHVAIVLSAGCILLLAWFAVHPGRHRAPRSQAPSTSSPRPQHPAAADAGSMRRQPGPLPKPGRTPSLAERQAMPRAERLACLERMGRVPHDADWTDVDLASQTTWWGKPIDRTEFWTNRAIWLDDSAMSEAAARGRCWPPIPYGEAELTRLYPAIAHVYPTDGKTIWSQPGAEGPNVARGGAYTSKEAAFWCSFLERQSIRPPEVIERAQLELAEASLGSSRYLQYCASLGMPVSAEDLAKRNDSTKKDFENRAIPSEALTDDALRWAYVLKCRRDYQRLLDRGQALGSSQSQSYLGNLLVDPKLITEPLAPNQSGAGSVWKIAYLKRLRRENMDQSYINAYLQAWNLSGAELLEGTHGP